MFISIYQISKCMSSSSYEFAYEFRYSETMKLSRVDVSFKWMYFLVVFFDGYNGKRLQLPLFYEMWLSFTFTTIYWSINLT